jgi:drug/metabolite transporter (DMT)-like permease
MSCARMAFLLNLSPFIAALLSYVLLSQTLSYKKKIGIAVGFSGGTLPLFLNQSISLSNKCFFFSLPDLVLFFAIGAHFYGLIITQKLILQSDSIALTNGIRMLAGGTLALCTSTFFEGFFPVHNVLPFTGWLVLLFVLSNVICHNAYLYLLKRHSVTFLSLTDFLIQFFTALYGWLFLQEHITSHYILSSCIISCGLFIFYQDEIRYLKTESASTRKS